MMLKNYNLVNMLKGLFIYIFLITGWAIYSAFKNKTIYRVHAVINAVAWNLSNLKYIWIQRVKVQRIIRKVSDEKIFEILSPIPIFIHKLKQK